MTYVNHSAREIAVGVVLHGPAGAGRRTTREHLARQLPIVRGRVDNFFDEDPPLRFPTGREIDGYSVVAYIDLALHARMDVVVVVVDLSPSRREANIAALAALRAWPEIPRVLQLNKCDLAERMSLADAIALDLGLRGCATIETSARDGVGIDDVITTAVDAACARAAL